MTTGRGVAAAMILLAGVAIPASAGAGQMHRGDAASCLVEVLSSEELPVGPTFYHTVRTTLRVTPPDGAAFVTTVQRAIPWQAPPPRRGRLKRMPCDPALWESSFRLF